MAYANGERAWAICDRCGERWRQPDLARQVVNRKATDIRVCPRCLDVDNPQQWVGDPPVRTTTGLRNPRPDLMVDSAFAFPPQSFNTYSTLQTVNLQ